MEKVTVEKSLFDEKFRNTCTQMLNSAQKDVYIIAGELSSLKFYDMRTATEHAAKRGAKVHVYATEHTPEAFRNYAVSQGYELFIGKEGLETHYLMVDGENMVISKYKTVGETTVVGERDADVIQSNKKEAKKILKEFERLTSKKDTIKVTKFDKTIDPFYQFVSTQ